MSVTDPIADYLTRLRNSLSAKRKRVEIPYSGVKREISRLLKEKKYITDFTEVAEKNSSKLILELRYNAGKSVISGLKRISKPGLRVYAKADEMPRVLGGLGIALISTSKGIMTEKQARIEGIGGEVLCHIW